MPPPEPPTKEWLAKQYHSGRFDLQNAHYYILSDEEHENLANGFNNLATEASGGDLRLPKNALIGSIQSQLSSDFPSAFAELSYQILAYHSTAPFYSSPTSTSSRPESLSLQDVQRALVWLLPGRHLSMSTIGNFGRIRTRADQRRLIFQSLASRCVPTTDNDANENARRRLAHENAFDLETQSGNWGDLSDYASVNRDDDGDEMYHDLLDVLSHNVPENYPYGSKRDNLRPLGKELKADFDFHTLAVPRDELKLFVRMLLALQFEAQTSIMPDLLYLDDAVASTMATFVCDDTSLEAAYPSAPDIIAWPAFDHGVKNLAHLFDPIYRALNNALINGDFELNEVPPLYGVPPELQTQDQEYRLLDLARMALTAAVVPLVVDWDTFHTLTRWRRKHDVPPTSDSLWNYFRTPTLDSDAEEPTTLFAFSGPIRDSPATRFVGGVLVAADYEGSERVYSIYLVRLESRVWIKKLKGQAWCRGPSGELAIDGTDLKGFRLDVGSMEIVIDGVDVEIDTMEVWRDGA